MLTQINSKKIKNKWLKCKQNIIFEIYVYMRMYDGNNAF